MRAPDERGRKEPFPRTFYVANGIELFERMSFYGMFVGLSLYLTNTVGLSDLESGVLLGNFRLVSSLAPIPCGAIADRITFKRSLMIAFALYVMGYVALFAFPYPVPAALALIWIAVASGFMKPVITGTVVRTAPDGRQTEGFAIFYRMINAGSVVGKSMAYGIRLVLGLRFVILNSALGAAIALGLATFLYTEPQRGKADKESFGKTMRGYGVALKNLRFTAFLVIFAGFYFMADQFYFTFPKYVTRHISEKAPLEVITLINPALIAIGQGVVSRLFARFDPLTTMIAGMFIGALSMLVMGIAPGMAGACLSGAIFAVAEMTFSPRFYDYVASFAPAGKAGMFMGLAFVPQMIGSWLGGQASGVMVSGYLPANGPRDPTLVWTAYAGFGAACGLGMLVYRWAVRRSMARGELAKAGESSGNGGA